MSETLGQGEVLGEALVWYFVGLDQNAGRDPNGQRFSGLKPRPRRGCDRCRPSNAQGAVRERVAGLAKGLVSKSRREQVEELVRTTSLAVEQYRAIESDAPDEVRGVAHSMVVHETAPKGFKCTSCFDVVPAGSTRGYRSSAITPFNELAASPASPSSATLQGFT
jgi:hypothetical protein